MASEAKDVGILAMDIYFPPNCVLQVPSPPLVPAGVSSPHSHSPSALPSDSPSSGAPGTHARAPPSVRRFQGERAARAGGVDTTTRFAWLRELFTVAAGSPAGCWFW
jgi:hypothetical protein